MNTQAKQTFDLSTNQGIFDKVTYHLLTQNRKSGAEIDDRFKCLYRGPDGTSCAVGCLIKDEFYNKDLEHKGCIKLSIKQALSKSGILFTSHTLDLLLDLQACHDYNEIDKWPSRLAKIARHYCLTLNLPSTGELRTQ